MWDSKVNRWNAGNMGPKRDLFGEFVEATQKADFPTVASFHHARTWNFAYKDFNHEFYTDEQKKKLDLFDPEKSDFFFGMPGGKYTIDDFANQWRDKVKKVVDKYHPDMLWYDGINRTLLNSPENYVVEVLNYYLKEGVKNGQEPVISSLALFTGCNSTIEEPQKPNVVIIYADDMGYGDVSYQNPEASSISVMSRMTKSMRRQKELPFRELWVSHLKKERPLNISI